MTKIEKKSNADRIEVLPVEPMGGSRGFRRRPAASHALRARWPLICGPDGQNAALVNMLDTALHITVLLHGLYVGVIPIWLHWHDQTAGRHGTTSC